MNRNIEIVLLRDQHVNRQDHKMYTEHAAADCEVKWGRSRCNVRKFDSRILPFYT